MSPDLPIVVEALSKTYRTRGLRRGAVQALSGVDLRVAPGEVFGLLGPNGAGKTTLVKVLLGIARPTEGAAYVFGRSPRDPASRLQVGYLPEGHRFPDFLTARQLLAAYGRLAALAPAEIRRRIPDVAERLDMGAWLDVRLRKFSKGMLQRIGLAQALLARPRLLLLDEPTDGVDPIGRQEIRALISGLSREGATIFLNSHLLSEVEQLCGRVAMLHKGRLVYTGGVMDAAEEGRYDILIGAPPPEPLPAGGPWTLRAAGPEPGGLYRCRLDAADRAALNDALDRLRAAGAELAEVRPRRRSLEERFIERIGAAKTPGEAL